MYCASKWNNIIYVWPQRGVFPIWLWLILWSLSLSEKNVSIFWADVPYFCIQIKREVYLYTTCILLLYKKVSSKIWRAAENILILFCNYLMHITWPKNYDSNPNQNNSQVIHISMLQYCHYIVKIASLITNKCLSLCTGKMQKTTTINNNNHNNIQNLTFLIFKSKNTRWSHSYNHTKSTEENCNGIIKSSAVKFFRVIQQMSATLGPL